ncbi:hypothetical protein GQX74_014042, partial [Glossina fuscipes]
TPDETEATEIGEEKKIESQLELERLIIEEKAERKLREVRQKAREEREARHHYPHIYLRFIQWLTNLDTFIIEFLGPELHRNYHSRHLNFSYDDIKRLCEYLLLRVFRFSNSRMDTRKLGILFDGLKDVSTLEGLDLALESNDLRAQAMKYLSLALLNYSQGKLKYLGLARNPLTDEALHSLISAIYDTEHIETLNLKEVTHLTEVGIAYNTSLTSRKEERIYDYPSCSSKLSAAACRQTDDTTTPELGEFVKNAVETSTPGVNRKLPVPEIEKDSDPVFMANRPKRWRLSGLSRTRTNSKK